MIVLVCAILLYEMFLTGPAIKVGDNVDTDAIIPARYCTGIDPQVLGSHLFEGHLEWSADKSPSGSILVAGIHFGCGSAREHAAIAVQGAGFSAVIAHSFSRTFFRNAVNIALPVFEVPGAGKIQNGDLLEIDTEGSVLLNRSTGQTYALTPFPEIIRNVIEAGGMIEFARRRLAEKEKKEKN